MSSGGLRPALLAVVTAAACATAPRVVGDRLSGPDNREDCPPARWISAVVEYDLSAKPLLLPPEGVSAGPGDRLVAVSHRTRFADGRVEAALERSDDEGASWSTVPGDRLWCSSSDAGTNGELGAEARDCSGRKQIRLSHEPEGASPARFRLVLRAEPEGTAWTGRVRLQVVAAACRGMDVCWGASGNNCDGAPASNCAEDADGLLDCPASVGSQAHDSCCSRWGARGFACGRCGNVANPRWGLDDCKLTSPPIGLPARLFSGPSGSFPGGYAPCRAEWDLAFRDVATLPPRLWSFPFDPLEITFRPRETTALLAVRGKPAVRPLEGAALFPSGARIRTIDAELGWCAAGRWHETDPANAVCE